VHIRLQVSNLHSHASILSRVIAPIARVCESVNDQLAARLDAAIKGAGIPPFVRYIARTGERRFNLHQAPMLDEYPSDMKKKNDR
jgi:hypothetical protein